MIPVPSPRAILHVDMDAFFAAIEQRDEPKLRGRPVLVGGAGPRGVVAAASYEARTFGCHSAQPMAMARRLCPQAVVLPPRRTRYSEVSRQVFAILDAFTPLVEPLSIDEAFLDVTGTDRSLGTPQGIATAIKKRIRDELGLTASVGVAPNKFLAKLASDLEKPDGLTVIEPEAIQRTIATLPINKMWGVGPATEQKLLSLGIRTFGDLQPWPRNVLESHFGSLGRKLHRLCRGEDDRPVVTDQAIKSISQEQTFDEDRADPDEVRNVLRSQAEKVAMRLRKGDLRGRTITVKIRFGDFQTITRSTTLHAPTDGTDLICAEARDLFDAWAATGFQPVRLIGVGISQLTGEAEQFNLFTQQTDDRSRRLDATTDAIRNKFGSGAVQRGAQP
jgi:nucleotidyltransferase/DNA polymerase involved in DNA repair